MAVDHGLVRASEAVIALAHGQLGPLVRAGAGVEIGAADPTPHDAKPDLARRGHGVGQLVDAELLVLADDGLHERIVARLDG